MLIVISPAKKLDFESRLPPLKTTQPRFLDDSAELIDQARTLSSWDIASLMKVSARIALLNAERFEQWSTPFTNDNARPAAYAFKGDTYKGLNIEQFGEDASRAAQSRLRILSGLYGVLRPLDLMQPYRLEMGTKLGTKRGKNLYEFWGDSITDQLREDMAAADTDVLLNLASKEYFNSVRPKQLPGPVIEPAFEDEKSGRYKIISFHAKRARGRMAAWVIKNGIDTPEALKQFREDGYRYHAESSTNVKPVFRRAEG